MKDLRKRLLSVSEASTYLGRSIPALRELIWAGKLPIVRSDRRIFLDVQDLDRWIDSHKTRYTF
ncbi:MAG: helix-turn-helix domain-containing protein [Nitrospinota bacterium]